jgi:hypothetical protein
MITKLEEMEKKRGINKNIYCDGLYDEKDK